MPELPSNLVVTDAEQTQVKNQWDTVGAILAKLERQGITIPKVPPSVPLPSIETTLVTKDNEEFLKLNATYLSWVNYVTPQITVLDMILLQIDNETQHLKNVYSQHAKDNAELEALHAASPSGKKKRTARTKEEVMLDFYTDPRVVELTRSRQEVDQERAVLIDVRDRLLRVVRVISRNVEVKKLDAETSGMLNPHRNFFMGGRAPTHMGTPVVSPPPEDPEK